MADKQGDVLLTRNMKERYLPLEPFCLLSDKELVRVQSWQHFIGVWRNSNAGGFDPLVIGAEPITPSTLLVPRVISNSARSDRAVVGA